MTYANEVRRRKSGGFSREFTGSPRQEARSGLSRAGHFPPA
jgi:hypothetical protein